ncbi:MULTISPECIES: hypothetical protein [Burkholderia]|uniref:hypothetical protein n=1 Tax=Burkholderia TaxID=32008 RepID=UPI000AB79B6A|nr:MULTISPECIES: hypothetical protein [Burkholderia]
MSQSPLARNLAIVAAAHEATENDRMRREFEQHEWLEGLSLERDPKDDGYTNSEVHRYWTFWRDGWRAAT